MGSGKGNPEYWVAVVKQNRVMFEVAGIPVEEAKECLKMCSYKLPIRTKIIKNKGQVAKYIHKDVGDTEILPDTTQATVEVVHSGNEVNVGAVTDKSEKKGSIR